MPDDANRPAIASIPESTPADLPPPGTTHWTAARKAQLARALGMLLGRLELFTVLVLFLPSFWRP